MIETQCHTLCFLIIFAAFVARPKSSHQQDRRHLGTRSIRVPVVFEIKPPVFRLLVFPFLAPCFDIPVRLSGEADSSCQEQKANSYPQRHSRLTRQQRPGKSPDGCLHTNANNTWPTSLGGFEELDREGLGGERRLTVLCTAISRKRPLFALRECRTERAKGCVTGD
jgi:hypothetical protein